MRKALTAVAVAALLGGLPATVPADPGGIDEGPGRGNPDTNPTGKCPPGQNKDTSPGGLKKCD